MTSCTACLFMLITKTVLMDVMCSWQCVWSWVLWVTVSLERSRSLLVCLSRWKDASRWPTLVHRSVFTRPLSFTVDNVTSVSLSVVCFKQICLEMHSALFFCYGSCWVGFHGSCTRQWYGRVDNHCTIPIQQFYTLNSESISNLMFTEIDIIVRCRLCSKLCV